MAATLINAWETLSKRNRGAHDYHSFGCSSISPPGFSSIRLSPLKILSSLLPSIAVSLGLHPRLSSISAKLPPLRPCL